MGGGNTREIYNYRERLISDDFNRAQRFIARDRAERERAVQNDASAYAFDYGSPRLLTATPASIAAPLRADIYEGLCVLPVSGSWSLYVTPGVVGMHDPDGETGSSDPNPPSPDDCTYKVVSDPGIDALDVLKVLTNATAFVRIDVVEVQRQELVVEEDNRDIYNPATRLFTPALVDKVTTGRLTYRVRQGVADSGLPACAQGWLPLAVIRVPAGATSTDDCDFWDVRPVVRDRSFAPYRDSRGTYGNAVEQQILHVDLYTAPGEARIYGASHGHTGTGLRAGGSIIRGVPGVDQEWINALAVDHQEPGFGFAGTTPWYLWHVFPLGLPRWVRYLTTPSGGVRFPYGPKGIPVISTKGPLGVNPAAMNPSTPITVPTSTGLLSVCDVGYCAGAWLPSGGAPKNAVTDGQWTLQSTGKLVAPFFGAGSVAWTDYRFTAGTDFPSHARAIRVDFTCELSGAAALCGSYDIGVTVNKTTTANELAHVFTRAGSVVMPAAGTARLTFTCDIPRPLDVTVFDVRVMYAINGIAAKGAEAASVFGWKL